MNTKFDELTKSMAQSVTRRGALKKFGVGIAGLALACFGLANKAEAGGRGGRACIKKCMKACVSQGIDPTYCQNACAFQCFPFP